MTLFLSFAMALLSATPEEILAEAGAEVQSLQTRTKPPQLTITINEGWHGDDKTLEHINLIPDLHTLRIEGDCLTAEELATIANQSLRRLQFQDVPHIHDESIKRFVHTTPNIEELMLFGTNITDVGIEPLIDFHHLQILTLNGTATTDGCIQYLRQIKPLRYLSLHGRLITDEGAQELADLSLTGLDLSQTAITDVGLQSLKPLTELKSLNLSNTRVSDEGISALSSFPHLVSLELSHTAVTDKGLASLRELKSLRSLDVANTNLRDTGLEHIVFLPDLSYVSARETQLTPDGVNHWLQTRRTKKLPALHIDH